MLDENKNIFIIFGLIGILICLFIYMIFTIDQRNNEYLQSHNCKVIHQNPDYTSLQWNGVVMQPTIHSGKKFYECENGEWQ